MRCFRFMAMFQSAAVGSTYAGDTGDRCCMKQYHYFMLFFLFELTFEIIHTRSIEERLPGIRPLGGLNERSKNSLFAMLTITNTDSHDNFYVFLYVVCSYGSCSMLKSLNIFYFPQIV